MPDASNVHGYASAADLYWSAGWRGPLPLLPRTKYPAIDSRCADHPHSHYRQRPRECGRCVSYTGYDGRDPSYADVMAWAESAAYRDGNLCLRLPDGVVGIDVDAYGAKTGARTYVEAVQRWGPLPYGPRSTSRRGDLTSGIRLFRVPPGTALETLLNFPELGVGDVEIVQYHHRYVVAWPSIHPEGGQYQWVDEYDRQQAIPQLDEIPDLPSPWIDGLRARPRVELTDVQLRYDVRRTFTAGSPSVLVAERLRQAIKELNIPGASRHDTCLRHVMALARLGKIGEQGVEHAMRILCDVLIALRLVDGSDTAEGTRGEFVRMLTNDRIALELSQPGLIDWIKTLVAEPPKSSTGDGQRAAADLESRGSDHWPADASPNPSALDPTTNSTPAPALADASAGVESASTASPMPDGTVVDDSAPRSPLEHLERGFWSSRASLASIWQTSMAQLASPWATLAVCAARALALVRPNATLPALIGGPGSLNFFVALVARSGGGKGAANGAADLLIPDRMVTTRNLGSGEGLVRLFDRGKVSNPDDVPTHESILINVDEVDTLTALGQRSGSTTNSVLCSAFMGEALGYAYVNRAQQGDVPQHGYRMTMVVSVQPRQAGNLMAAQGGGLPQRFMWAPATDPRISGDEPWPGSPLVLPLASEWRYPRTLFVPDEVRDFVRQNRVRANRDQDDALDGHAVFCREKFAQALALLDGRVFMTLEDWELSGIAADVSDHTRQGVLGVLREAAIEQAVERGQIRGVEMESSDAERVQAEIHRAQRVLNWLLNKLDAAGDEGLTQGALTEKIAGRDRRALSAILTNGHYALHSEIVDGALVWRRRR